MSVSMLNEIVSKAEANAGPAYMLLRKLIAEDLLDARDFVIRSAGEERAKNMSDTQVYLRLWSIIQDLRLQVANLQHKLNTKKG